MPCGRRLAKRLAEKAGEAPVVQLTGVSKPNDAEGASRREKNRLQLIINDNQQLATQSDRSYTKLQAFKII